MGLIKAGLDAPGVTTSLTVTPEDGYMLTITRICLFHLKQ